MLLNAANARVTAFAVAGLLRENQLVSGGGEGGGGESKLLPPQVRVKQSNYSNENCIQTRNRSHLKYLSYQLDILEIKIDQEDITWEASTVW